jgi:hypothetical protein
MHFCCFSHYEGRLANERLPIDAFQTLSNKRDGKRRTILKHTNVQTNSEIKRKGNKYIETNRRKRTKANKIFGEKSAASRFAKCEEFWFAENKL